MNKAKRLIRAKAKAKALRNKTYQPSKHKVLDEKHSLMLLKAVAGRKPRRKNAEKEDGDQSGNEEQRSPDGRNSQKSIED